MSLWLHIVTHPAYLLACVLVGVAGRKRRTGFFGYTVMSFLLTPLFTLFVLYVGGEKPRPVPDDLLDDLPQPRDAKAGRKG